MRGGHAQPLWHDGCAMTRLSQPPSPPPLAAAALPVIDWRAPWWAPLRAHGAPALARWAAGQTVAAALDAAGAAPVRFVPQAALPAGMAYERFVFEQGAVPTRDNVHDFLNGLIWLHWPQAKRRMNALQAAAIARDGVQARRGPVRDALTLLDENGALLAAPDALWQALRQRRWADLFGPLRPLWAQARLWLLGHATLEKLVLPYKSITAHVLPAPPSIQTMMDADRWLAGWLNAERLAPKPFAPLPLLGVPGWWAANADPAFYADAQVFRPPRPATPGAPADIPSQRHAITARTGRAGAQ